jgi:hypothetical protein
MIKCIYTDITMSPLLISSSNQDIIISPVQYSTKYSHTPHKRHADAPKLHAPTAIIQETICVHNLLFPIPFQHT